MLLDDGQSRELKIDDGLVAGEEAGADAEVAGGRRGVVTEELADLDELGIEPDDLG